MEQPATPRVSKITIGRLYNLGNYEHIRYEIAADVPEGASAETTLKNVQAALEGLSPRRTYAAYQVNRAHDFMGKYCDNIKEIMKMKDLEAKEAKLSALKKEYVESIKVLEVHMREERKSEEARELLNNLGGTSVYTDHKDTWDEN